MNIPSAQFFSNYQSASRNWGSLEKQPVLGWRQKKREKRNTRWGSLQPAIKEKQPNRPFKLILFWELPGGLVVKAQHFQCQGLGSIPGRGTKIPQATQCGQNQPTNQPSFLKTTLKQNNVRFQTQIIPYFIC